mmetsp:Transcript_46353/g.107050  ORF Transcript_46353/g.107050 Transcript_46353/m.107050 type:complete len:123 (-) Transcript_46353:969-1337(-)
MSGIRPCAPTIQWRPCRTLSLRAADCDLQGWRDPRGDELFLPSEQLAKEEIELIDTVGMIGDSCALVTPRGQLPVREKRADEAESPSEPTCWGPIEEELRVLHLLSDNPPGELPHSAIIVTG